MGQTRGKDESGGLRLVRLKRWKKGFRTATRLTRKQEVYVTSQGRTETWEGVAAMEDRESD